MRKKRVSHQQERVVALLRSGKGQAVPKAELIEAMQRGPAASPREIDAESALIVLIKALRKKGFNIETVKNVGYKLISEPEHK
jgi:DNA-binding winged helix-turn-helix (wHTH) protein